MSDNHQLVANNVDMKRVVNPATQLQYQINNLFKAAFKEVRATYSYLLKTPGDIEALHQFRISLRRVKSLLHSFEQVIRRSVFSTIYTNVSTPLKASNALRDYDVLIAALSSKQHLQNEPAIKHIETVNKHLKQIRNHSRQQFFQQLQTWQIVDLPAECTRKPYRSQSFTDFMQTSLAQHQKVIKSLIGKIKHTNRDEPFHRLRIAFKQYRYLLEMSPPSFIAEGARTRLKQLKVMQTLLGKFNDYAVWQQHLASLGNSGRISDKVSYACGVISTVCWFEQHQLLPAIRESTSDFVS